MMKLAPLFRRLVLAAFLCRSILICAAQEENLTPLTTGISQSILSGYVDVTAVWIPQTPVTGFAGTWMGIVTDRSSTNRFELFLIVNEEGNFVGRGLNFDRTLGSEQLQGYLNRNGRAKIGQSILQFHRGGMATIIGRGENGRFYSAKLFREKIR